MAVLRRALLISTGERYFALAINFATIALVSRLLTPEEIGISVIGMAFVGFAMAAREFASANFLISRQELTRDEVRGTFTVIVSLTLLISLTLACTAPLLAAIYGESSLVPYLRLISAALVVELIAAPIVTLLRRDMEFGKIAIINVSGAVSAAAVTVLLASMGFSYMSFAWAWLASAVVTGLLALSLSQQFWIFKPFFKNWHGTLAFGAYNGATNTLYRFYETLPYLVLGRLLSPDAAAVYSRSLMICQLPDKVFLAGAVSVALPAFSRETRQGRNLKESYLKALGLITVLQWPALLVLAIIAYPVVDVLLGHQWHAVAPIAQIMAIASLFSFSFELNYPVLVSLGAVRDIFRRALIVCPISAAIITLASFHGLQEVALSLLLVIPFQAFVSLQFVRRHVNILWSEIAASVWRSASVAAITAAGPLSVVMLSGSNFDISISQALVAAALAAAGWCFGLYLTGHPLLLEISETLMTIRNGLSRAWAGT